MSRRWRIRLLIAGAVGPLLVVAALDRVQTMYWVGHTDLEVEFAITDAAAGSAVPGARVEILQEAGGFYEDRDEKSFVLVTWDDGLTRQECRKSMCFGTRSGLGFTDTFAVHVPNWWFRVVAGGYQPSEWTYLNVPAFGRQARRAGPGHAKLVVPVLLHNRRAGHGRVRGV